MSLTLPERATLIRRAAARLCVAHGWAPLHEVALPNGRRADILALSPELNFFCIEVKSGARDFLVDAKWPEYREFCDCLYFAVDTDFPTSLLPDDVGLIVCADTEAAIIRDAPPHKLSTVRRKSLLGRFAMLAAWRLQASIDPATRDTRAD